MEVSKLDFSEFKDYVYPTLAEQVSVFQIENKIAPYAVRVSNIKIQGANSFANTEEDDRYTNPFDNTRSQRGTSFNSGMGSGFGLAFGGNHEESYEEIHGRKKTFILAGPVKSNIILEETEPASISISKRNTSQGPENGFGELN